MEKLTKVKVTTPKGVRTLLFRKVMDVPTDKIICDEICPYGKVCDKLSDPRCPGDPERTFIDFCGDLGSEDGEADLRDLIPVEGTIEDNLSDISEPYQDLVESGARVPVGDIIEKVCSGWCDSYTPEHDNCNCSNRSCILKDLFLGQRKRKEDEKNK